MPKLDEFSLRPKKVLSVLFPFIRVESFLVVSIDMSLPIIPQLLTASSLLDDNKRRVAIRIFLVFYLPLLRLLVHANISSAYNIVVNKQRNSRHCSKTYDSAQSEFPSKFFWMNIALPKKQLQSLNLWKVVQSCCFFFWLLSITIFFHTFDSINVDTEMNCERYFLSHYRDQCQSIDCTLSIFEL